MTAAFDWEALSRRLEAAAAGLDALDRIEPGARERVLAARAAAANMPDMLSPNSLCPA